MNLKIYKDGLILSQIWDFFHKKRKLNGSIIKGCILGKYTSIQLLLMELGEIVEIVKDKIGGKQWIKWSKKKISFDMISHT